MRDHGASQIDMIIAFQILLMFLRLSGLEVVYELVQLALYY